MRPTKVLRRLSDEWAKRTLSTRFVIAATGIILATMLHLGAWMDSRIRNGVVQAAAISSARYMEQTLHDDLQGHSSNKSITQSDIEALSNLIGKTDFGRTIIDVRVWLPDGTLAYTSRGGRAGDKPLPSGNLLGALSGQLRATLHVDPANVPNDDRPSSDAQADTGADTTAAATTLNQVPVFKVYAPIRDSRSGSVIGVSEFYEDATSLLQEFTIERQQNWIVIGSLTLGMLALLFGIVHRGSLLILEQKHSLQERLAETSRLLQQNEKLRARLIETQHQAHEISDRLLRRIGADLHDGPAQLMSIALLRLHEITPKSDETAAHADRDPDDAASTIRLAMQDALTDIRNISSGMSLPQLEELTLAETIQLASSTHERRTKTKVAIELENLSCPTSLVIRTCTYRCIQEGLNNAFHHAGGKGQSVQAHCDGTTVTVSVHDRGPGFITTNTHPHANALGLAGLRHRVELLGGILKVNSRVGGGTTVSIALPLRYDNDKEI